MYYIAVLVNLALMGIVPHTGWIQHMPGYETMEICEESIEENKPFIEYRILHFTQGFGFIEEIECITEEEYIKRNKEMGHKVPDFKKQQEEPREKLQ